MKLITTPTDNLTWINSAFPVYNNLLDLQIHNRDVVMAEYMPASSSDTHNWSYKSGLDSLLNKEFIQASSRRSVNQTGFYFCADDAILDENLMHGTWKQANEKCKSILTPKICHDKNLKNRLTELSKVSEAMFIASAYNLGTKNVLNNNPDTTRNFEFDTFQDFGPVRGG